MGILTRPEKERRQSLPRAKLIVAGTAESLLLRQFREFVDAVRQQLVDAAPANLDLSDPAVSQEANNAAKKMSDNIARIAEAQDLQFSREASQAELMLVDELRYLKAAMADELLLSEPWSGRPFFTSHLVETRLFGSSLAGDKIFDRISQLLGDASSRAQQLAPLYLFAVAIGFQGRFRGPDADDSLIPIRDALYRKIYRREPLLKSDLAEQPAFADRVLSEQAYKSVLSNIEPVRFFRFSQSTLMFIGSLLALLILSQILWRWSSSPLRRALDPAAPAKIERPVSSEVSRG
jgi:type VI secretion system protein ImpK